MKSHKGDTERTSAFARIELLAVIFVLLLLAAIQGPSLANSNMMSQRVLCMSNHKQLIQAWLMYAQSNEGRLVENVHGNEAIGAAGRDRFAAWAFGWLDWTLSRDNTNVQFLIDPRYGRLADYLNRDPRVFKCPSDVYVSRAQEARGWEERVRSYSMNVAMGRGNQLTGPSGNIEIFTTLGEIVNPPPNRAFVFIDEHPDSINDPLLQMDGFATNGTGRWLDLPGSYHNGGTPVSMADGHVEMRQWREPRTKPRVTQSNFFVPNVVNSEDLKWLRERTSSF